MGKSVCGTLSNTTKIINYEKFSNPRATEMYYKYIVNESAGYYERLINKIIERKMVKPVDARVISEPCSCEICRSYCIARAGGLLRKRRRQSKQDTGNV